MEKYYASIAIEFEADDYDDAQLVLADAIETLNDSPLGVVNAFVGSDPEEQ